MARSAGKAQAAASPQESDGVPLELDAGNLAALEATFTPPRWLRDLGRTSWALVGFVLLLVGAVWLLGQTATIVQPVVAGLVVATVASPAVASLERHRIGRGIGALLVLLGLIAAAAFVLVLVVSGIVGQADAIGSYADAAVAKAQKWLVDAGVDSSGASAAAADVKQGTQATLSTLVHGVATGISGLASLVFGFVFTGLSIFFLLKDGPKLRTGAERHLGVPLPVARVITKRVITSVRQYFLGVTIVAGFNGVVVGLGALLLGVPLAGTIAVVNFVTAYVPYVGALTAGVFTVAIALGAKGTTVAIVMLVIFILANGLLQNIFQPIAFGATLNLNPLVVLVVTIAAGSLFGMVGLVLAAPLTSAAVHIGGDLARARVAAGQEASRSVSTTSSARSMS